MYRAIVSLLSIVLAASVWAQGTAPVQRSSSAQGVQIQGDTKIGAVSQNASAVAAGDGNTAGNTTGSVKGGTQIQGTTRINANTKNVNAVSVGKGNAAANDIGSIGGK